MTDRDHNRLVRVERRLDNLKLRLDELYRLASQNGHNHGEVQSFTPDLTATTTNPNLGNGSIVGRYRQTVDVVEAWIWLQFGGTGETSGDGVYELSLPVDADTTLLVASASAGEGQNVGGGNCRNVSTPGDSQQLAAFLASASTVRMMAVDSNTVQNSQPFGEPWGEDDSLSLHLVYIAA